VSRSTLVFLAALAVLPGCSEHVTLAVGPAGDITIFTELPEESVEVSTLLERLRQEVVVIRPEPAFNVEISGPDGFDLRRNWRNLLFLGSLDGSAWMREKIRGLLSETQFGDLESGRRSLFLIKDKWALGQLVVVLATKQRGALAEAVDNNAQRIYDAFDRAAVENTRRILLKKDVQRDTARYLSRNYGWSILVPDYFEVVEDKDAAVVLFRAEEPARMILVHWEDWRSQRLEPEECLALRGKLAWNIYDQDYIARDMTETKETSFLGRKALKITGIWQNDKHQNGGPFRTFCFLEGGRLYLVDTLVYAPEYDKLPYLRELEAIARTFSTG